MSAGCSSGEKKNDTSDWRDELTKSPFEACYSIYFCQVWCGSAVEFERYVSSCLDQTLMLVATTRSGPLSGGDLKKSTNLRLSSRWEVHEVAILPAFVTVGTDWIDTITLDWSRQGVVVS